MCARPEGSAAGLSFSASALRRNPRRDAGAASPGREGVDAEDGARGHDAAGGTREAPGDRVALQTAGSVWPGAARCRRRKRCGGPGAERCGARLAEFLRAASELDMTDG